MKFEMKHFKNDFKNLEMRKNLQRFDETKKDNILNEYFNKTTLILPTRISPFQVLCQIPGLMPINSLILLQIL